MPVKPPSSEPVDEIDLVRRYRVKVSVKAVAFVQAHQVGHGVAEAAGQREMLVRIVLSVIVPAPTSAVAQSLTGEVLASLDSEQLCAAAQLFSVGAAAPPSPSRVRRIEIVDCDEFSVLDVTVEA